MLSDPTIDEAIRRSLLPLSPMVVPAVVRPGACIATDDVSAVMVPAWVESWRSTPCAIREVCRSISLVGDACAVIQDLRHTARTGRLGAIGQIALLGALHMPEEMVAEAEMRMVRVATEAVPV